MIISRKIEIDMGHRIPNHKSKCRNLHGHRYVIEVYVEGEENKVEGASDEGMVLDYGDLKQIMIEEIHNRYDHSCILYKKDEASIAFKIISDKFKLKTYLLDFIPTAELLAKHFWELIEDRLKDKGFKLHSVIIHETPNCKAIYENK